MAYVISKGGKYLKSHGYCTGFGYSFSWSKDIANAKIFDDGDASIDMFAKRSRGRILPSQPTAIEDAE